MSITNWNNAISNDLNALSDFIMHFETELNEARNEVKIDGSLEEHIKTLPSCTETRFYQLQEIESVLNYMNIRLRTLRRNYFVKYTEKYNKTLSSRDAEKYVDGEKEVVDFELLVNEVALLRNKWLGILKGLESKNFMLGHITKLKCAGLEDVLI